MAPAGRTVVDGVEALVRMELAAAVVVRFDQAGVEVEGAYCHAVCIGSVSVVQETVQGIELGWATECVVHVFVAATAVADALMEHLDSPVRRKWDLQ